MAQVQEKQTTAVKEIAKKYVDAQLEVLKRHGSLGRISKTRYKTIVNQVAKVTK
jgi:hypothetical protein